MARVVRGRQPDGAAADDRDVVDGVAHAGRDATREA
jgi:hypothetical protein